MRPNTSCLAVIVFAAAFVAPAQLAAQTPALPCADCVSITIGPAMVIRGPAGDESDAPFVALKLPDGTVRGFVSNTVTYAVDGKTATDMGGARRAVMRRGDKGTAAECGNWITGLSRSGSTLYALVHNEAVCNYERGETHKSMAMASSNDNGLTWRMLGTIAEASEKSAPGKLTGEGDCTLADGHDGFLYMYCLRAGDWKITAMRAPRDDPAAGRWMKWDGSSWRTPALGGDAAPLVGFPGHSAAWWTTQKLMLLLAVERSLKLSLSSDSIRFAQLPAPLVLYDADEWNRPAPTALYAYPSLVNADGGNDVGDNPYLTYAYVPPDAGFTERYLVMHAMRMTMQTAPAVPQVRTALARYVDAKGVRMTTGGPPIVAGERPTFRLEKELGYLLTVPPPGNSVMLQECAGAAAGYFVSDRPCSSDLAARRRTAGYLYLDPQPQTQPLYACTSANGRQFSSNEADCEGLGAATGRMGFVLAR
jgi:hypothetical protein